MNILNLGSAAAVSLLVAACGEPRTPAGDNRTDAAASADPQPTQIHSGTGTIRAVAGDQVTIAHGPVESLGWPAMTMTFTAPPGTSGAAAAGSPVDFSFRQEGSAYVLTSLAPR